MFKQFINKVILFLKGLYIFILNKWDSFINLKIVKIFFKFLPHNIFLFLFMILSVFCMIKFCGANRNDILFSQAKSDGVFDPIIVDPVEISFEDVDISKTPSKLCITFATYSHKTNSEYKYQLLDMGNVIDEINFNSNVLNDGQEYCFPLNNISEDKISNYSVKIVPIYTDLENVITIFKDKSTNIATFSIKEDLSLFNVTNLLVFIYCCLFLFINYLINKKSFSYEKYWLLISLIYIIPLTVFIPPYQVPDEPVHFFGAYRLTQLDLNVPLSQSVRAPEIYAPSNIGCLNYSNIEVVDKVKDTNEILDCLKEVPNKNDYTYRSYNYVNTKIGYLFASLGIKVADIFTNSSLVIFYCGRLFNTFLSILVIYFAIKISPKHKELLLSLALIPMFIQQMVSYNYDSILNSCVVMSLSLIFYLIYSKDKKFVLPSLGLIVCGMFIGDIKLIYLTGFLLLLFIPNEKFKKIFKKYLYCFFIILISYVLSRFSYGIFNDSSTSIVSINPDSLSYLMRNPLLIFRIAYNTVKLNGLFYLRSMIGWFGWFRFKLDDFIVCGYYVFLIYLMNKSRIKYDKFIDKIIIIIGLLLTIAAIFGSMYLSWTKVGLNYVDGVQGRYFLPLIIPLIMVIVSKRRKGIDRKVSNEIVYNFTNIIVLYYIISILTFYY